MASKPKTPSEMAWTPEPWKTMPKRSAIFAGDPPEPERCECGATLEECDEPGTIIGGFWTSGEEDAFHPRNLANTNRAVSCVNALAGIPDPAAFVAAVRAAVEAGAIDEIYLSLIREELTKLESTKPSEKP